MEFKTVMNLLWHIVVVNGWSVAWRVGLLSVVFGGLGLLLLGLAYRVFFRAGYLKLSLKRENFFEWLVMGAWILGLPSLTVAVGVLLGAWWSGSFLIESERLGEKVGKAAFQTVAAGLAASNAGGSATEQTAYAEALMSGQEKLSIEQLHKFSTHHAGELSAAQLEALLPVSKDGMVHHGTIWAVEKTLDTVAYIELSSEGDMAFRLASEVAAHDRETDADGMVTVKEVSDVACEVFLDRAVHRIWAALMLELILPVLALLLALFFAPPLLAWLVRKALARWGNPAQTGSMV